MVNILEKSLYAVDFLVKLFLNLLKNQNPRNSFLKTMDLSAFIIVFCIYSQRKSSLIYFQKCLPIKNTRIKQFVKVNHLMFAACRSFIFWSNRDFFRMPTLDAQYFFIKNSFGLSMQILTSSPNTTPGEIHKTSHRKSSFIEKLR